MLNQDARPAVRGLTAPNRPEVVPDLRLKEVQNLPLTKTRLVRFEQTRSKIPIFGSQVVVEIYEKRELGLTIKEARVACKAASKAGDLAWASYILYKDPRVLFRKAAN